MPDRSRESIAINITAANGEKTNEITISPGQSLSYKHIWENVCIILRYYEKILILSPKD